MSIGSGVGIGGIGGIEASVEDLLEGVLAITTDSTLAWVGAPLFIVDLTIATSSTVVFTGASIFGAVLAIPASSTVALTGASLTRARFLM